MDQVVTNTAVSPKPHGVSLGEAFRVWLRVADLSFGGPAGQIAVMHRILVEEKRWISENRFLHALNYCMLLPGPEAQQLATYVGWLKRWISENRFLHALNYCMLLPGPEAQQLATYVGWLMHRTLGGIMAGGLFILPGVVAKSLRVAVVWLGLWLVPVFALIVTLGETNVFSQIAIFFSKMAMVTFGGAYAVLAYVAQQAVENYSWLAPGEMLDGLGMAETTPGPLIMVLQFVGFMGAFRGAGSAHSSPARSAACSPLG